MTVQQHKIVALHGAGMLPAVWDTLGLPLRALSLPRLPSIEQIAQWVREKNESQDDVILMGHSMGALVALEVAAHPAVAGLILLGAAAQMPVHPDLLRQAQEAPENAVSLILKWGVSPTAEGDVKPALKAHMVASALYNDLFACDQYKGSEAAAKKIQKPTLVISGSDDRMTKAADGKALAEMISSAEFHALPGCGHMIMAEKPRETAELIRAFLARLPG